LILAAGAVVTRVASNTVRHGFAALGALMSIFIQRVSVVDTAEAITLAGTIVATRHEVVAELAVSVIVIYIEDSI
jgi:small ligand-binding sensory domain FIST